MYISSQGFLFYIFVDLDLTGLNSYWQSVYHYADLSPQADDALVTVGYALSRLTASRLDNCTSKLSPSKLLTITSYHYQDRYEVISNIMFLIDTTHFINSKSL